MVWNEWLRPPRRVLTGFLAVVVACRRAGTCPEVPDVAGSRPRHEAVRGRREAGRVHSRGQRIHLAPGMLGGCGNVRTERAG